MEQVIIPPGYRPVPSNADPEPADRYWNGEAWRGRHMVRDVPVGTLVIRPDPIEPPKVDRSNPYAIGVCGRCAWEFMDCRLQRLVWTPTRTLYPDPESNFSGWQCQEHHNEYNEEWDERWEEYYAGLL